jgi:hypothetical protein
VRQDNRERRPSSNTIAVSGYSAAEQFDQLFTNSQTEPHTPLFTKARFTALHERVENIFA